MLKHCIANFLARIWQRIEFFFVCHLGQKFLPSDCTQTVTLLLGPQFVLISPWLAWKQFYVETMYSEFFLRDFDCVSSTSFVYHQGKKLFPSQTILGQWKSSLDPKFIWISPWLGWKTIFVETLYSEFFRAQFGNVSSNFFIYHPGQELTVSLWYCIRTLTLLPWSSIHLN